MNKKLTNGNTPGHSKIKKGDKITARRKLRTMLKTGKLD